jgi:hypothetical protein
VSDVVPLCQKIGLLPKRAWIAGQPRTTPKGRPLEGIHEDSYCYCELPFENAVYLEDALNMAVDLLIPHLADLNDFCDDGGRISLFISLEKGAFQGAVLPPTLLATLGSLRVVMEIDRDL